MADIMDRIGALAEEFGNLDGQLKTKLMAFGLAPGQTIMAMDEVTMKFQSGTMQAELFGQLAEYWQLRDRVTNRRELLEALKVAIHTLSTLHDRLRALLVRRRLAPAW